MVLLKIQIDEIRARSRERINDVPLKLLVPLR